MALGGGVFLTQKKVLPGAYVNFVAVKKAKANLSERGFLTMPLELDWGVDGEVFEVTSGDFQKNSLAIFGYSYTDEKLKGLRDAFANAKVLYAYRLNSGEKATNKFATAKHSGIRGNDVKITIRANIDDNTKFDVITLIDGNEVDKQLVGDAKELVANDFVTWKDVALENVLAVGLTGGTNGVVTGNSHQEYLGKIENYAFNVLAVVTEDEVIKALYANYTKRLRDEVGAKFQTVLHNYSADYEGVINLKNDVTNDVTNDGVSKASLVYWVAGLEAGCNINKSCLNTKYDGEFDVFADYTQRQLENCINKGEFVLHRNNGEIMTLGDINSLVTETVEKSSDFKQNQTIRVLDQIANDIAVLFSTKYLGVVPNDNAGRVALWSDVVQHHEALQSIRAITNFSDKDVTVEQGEEKNSVLLYSRVEPINAMVKLYMVVRVG